MVTTPAYFLSDTDFYKFSMQYAMLRLGIGGAPSEYRCVQRGSDQDFVAAHEQQVAKWVARYRVLRFSEEEKAYLSSMREGIFSDPAYQAYLNDFDLRDTAYRSGCVRGAWAKATWWEVPYLAHLHSFFLQVTQKLDDDALLDRHVSHLGQALNALEKNPATLPMAIAEFGTRRRCSPRVHEAVKALLSACSCTQFLGTSNVCYAYRLHLLPIGTMAHEWLQVGQSRVWRAQFPEWALALSEDRAFDNLEKEKTKRVFETVAVESQVLMLKDWCTVYAAYPAMRVALTDIFGVKIFFLAMLQSVHVPGLGSGFLYEFITGLRHDSGDPVMWLDRVIQFYAKIKISLHDKTLVFSDALNADTAQRILRAVQESFPREADRPKIVFGIGTWLTNQTGFPHADSVFKMISYDGIPNLKLSDSMGKHIDPTAHAWGLQTVTEGMKHAKVSLEKKYDAWMGQHSKA